ncbi:MAG TPA: ABC transporter permease [Gemmatimonadaceae bacterium]|jgi:predicted permease
MSDTRRRFSEQLDELKQDVRFAVRTLAKNRAFTAIAVITLALGIGANSAIFSVVNGVLLQPLPYPHPEQLLRTWQSFTTPTSSVPGAISAVNLDDWRARRRVLADIGGYWFSDGQSGTDMTGTGEPQRLSATFVTPGFWNALAVPPALGRVPRDDEMVRGSNDRLVVLSYAFWQRQFGGARSVVGSRVTLGGETYEIVGVMPESFRFPSSHADLYIPFSTIPDNAIPRLRPVRILSMVARMKPGVTVAQANAEVNSIAHVLAEEYPTDNENGPTALALPLQESIVGNVRTSLLVLLGAVGFVLLIASVNLAGLLLARATSRERELAVRAALGAAQSRLVRQLFTESLVLACIGGTLGIFVAKAGMQLLITMGGNQLPRVDDIRIDGHVLLFTVGLSILTGIAFGLVPAIRASHPELQRVLREGSRGSTRGGGRLRDALVVAEVALAMVLVVGAGLMTRSFIELTHVDLGFTPENRLAVNYTISTARHSAPGEYIRVYREMLDKVRSVPGVVAAGAIRDLPFHGEGEPIGFTPPGGAPSVNGNGPTAILMFTSDGFFNAIGIPLLAGRDLSQQDRQGAPSVFVVNQAFAKRYFDGRNPVGQLLTVGKSQVPIVGLVGDVRQKAVDEAPEPRIYASVYQISRVKVNLVVRTRENPQLMIKRVEDAIHAVDPQQTITAAFTLDDAVGEAVARPRLLTLLLGLFGAMGLVLGALGIYGVLAYLVTQRTREIGVRLALGAQRRNVLTMVLGSGLRLAAIGVVIGIAGALALTRLMSGVLYGVSATDPLTFGMVGLVLLGVAAIASGVPAWRAMRVDPVEALRSE